MIETIVLTLRICVVMLAVFAAYEDVRYLRIRNTIAMAVAVLFIPVAFTLPLHSVMAHGIGGAVVLLVGFVLFMGGLLGGGDAKLLGALALWLEPGQLPAFLLIMACAGGVVALVALGFKKVPALTRFLPVLATKAGDKSWFAALSRQETVVPYGVAIAIATLFTFFTF